MKKTNITILSAAASAGLIMMLGASLALAQTSSATPLYRVRAGVASSTARMSAAESRAAAAIIRAKDNADKEISRRTNALSALSDRIEQMKNVSSSDSSSLMGQVQSQISALATLKTQIDVDTSTTTLKEDVKSITDSYRIYMLVIPQGALLAAVDRIDTLVTAMTTVGAKLQDRITVAESSGTDVSSVQATMTDYQAKVADAQAQATAAQGEIANLQPDNGVSSIATANTTALKDARVKVQAAQKDLTAARKDLATITKFLSKNASATVPAPVTSTTTAQ